MRRQDRAPRGRDLTLKIPRHGALAPGEAATLLARLAAWPGIRATDAAVGEITRLCGCLPLATGMLARQLSHHPAWTAADIAASLAAARDRHRRDGRTGLHDP